MRPMLSEKEKADFIANEFQDGAEIQIVSESHPLRLREKLEIVVQRGYQIVCSTDSRLSTIIVLQKIGGSKK